MNKRNLFFIPLAAMLLAGCNFTAGVATTTSEPAPSTSQADPVSRIKVTAPAADIVVGDVVDLDNYVKVVGGTDAAAYEITVAPSSADVVEFDGHVMTVLKAGAINLDVKSTVNPAITAVVEWTAYHPLVAKYKGATNGLTNVFGFETDWDQETGDCTEKIVHNEAYCMFPGWNDDTKAAKQAGGFVVINGSTYQYLATDTFGKDAEALPGKQSAFGLYFVNAAWCLDASYLEVVEDQEHGDYLVLDPSVASPQADYFDSVVEEFAYCALASNLAAYSGYTPGPIYISYDEECEQFGFTLTLVKTSNSQTYKFMNAYLNTSAEFTTIAPVQGLIDAGVEPVAIDVSEVGTFGDAAMQAKNYTYTASYGWVDDDTYEPVAWSSVGFHASWEVVFPEASETGIVTEDGTYASFVQKEYYDAEYTALAEPVDLDPVRSGFINHEDAIWQYYESEETAGQLDAEQVAAGNVWDVLPAAGYTAGALASTGALFAKIAASDRAVDETTGAVTLAFDTDTATALTPWLLNQVGYGAAINYYFKAQFGATYAQYTALTAEFTATTAEFFWVFRLSGGYYYSIDVTFGGAGTAVLPAELANINYVTAA